MKWSSHREEAIYFHESLFGRLPEDSFVEAYIQAHGEIPELREISAKQSESLRKIVYKRLAVVAIEPWLRNKDRRHPLTSKLLLVAYLAESDAKHCEFNRNNTNINNPLLKIVGRGVFGGIDMMWGLIQKFYNGII